MPYDPVLVQPMREELTKLGVQELRTAQDVDTFLTNKTGTAMIVVNSVCGCAAGGCRPGIKLSLNNAKKPARLGTVFAGQDIEAVAKARSFLADIPPSSPAIMLFKDGELVHYVPRHQIEGRDPGTIATDLTKAYNQYC